MNDRPTNHKALGITAVLKDFSQKQYEIYHEGLLAAIPKSTAVKNGVVVRQALNAGFLANLTIKEKEFIVSDNSVPSLDDCEPAAIVWLSKKIHEHVLAVTNPPDDPN